MTGRCLTICVASSNRPRLAHPCGHCCGCRRAMKNWLPRCARMGHKVNGTSIKRLLPKLGFSRQSNRKADERSYHPDRNGQFEHINIKVPAAPAAGQPVISVDTTKKKELVGNFKNAGSTTPALDGCGLRDHWLARPAGQA